MKILFDQNVPGPLRKFLPGHEVRTARNMGWELLENGLLLSTAEIRGFNLLVTADQNLSYQQNLAGRQISILELTKNNWSVVRLYVDEIARVVNASLPGSYEVVVCSYPSRLG